MAATASPPDGKAILTTNGDITIDGFEFSGAAVPDQNGAGIRHESGNLTILNSHFHHNQMGLLTTANDGSATLTIRGSEFDHNGNGPNHTHNLYVNHIGKLTVDNSYFHDAEIGHELKSRAEETIITNSRFADFDSTASYSIDLPNGGHAVLTNNFIQQGPNSDNPVIVAFGEEGNVRAGSSLTMQGNTVVNDLPGGLLLWNAAGAPATVADTKVSGLTAAQMASGPATVTGTTTLASDPVVDNTPPAQTSEPPPAQAPEPAGDSNGGADAAAGQGSSPGTAAPESGGSEPAGGGGTGADVLVFGQAEAKLWLEQYLAAIGPNGLDDSNAAAAKAALDMLVALGVDDSAQAAEAEALFPSHATGVAANDTVLT